jgi:hypothetical protein
MESESATQPTQTNGQKSVGLSFNPSGDDKVAKAKQLFAEAIDLLEQDFNEKQAKINDAGGRPSWYFNVFRTEAFNKTIGAQMAIVKFLTWKD